MDGRMTKPPATARKNARPPTPEKPRGRGARSVAEMLPDIGGAAFRRFGFVQSSVVSRWAEIVGARFADVTAPEMIRFPTGKRRDGTLVLTVESAFGPMIQHVVPVIVERVNRFFGYPAVARVTIRAGALPKPEPRRAPPSLKPVSAEIGDSLRAIADPELRDCLAALAAAVAASEARSIPIQGKIS
jgi:hypothetical protein